MKDSIIIPETPDPDQLDLALDVPTNTRDPTAQTGPAENPGNGNFLINKGGLSASQLALAKHLKSLSLTLKNHPPAQEE